MKLSTCMLWTYLIVATTMSAGYLMLYDSWGCEGNEVLFSGGRYSEGMTIWKEGMRVFSERRLSCKDKVVEYRDCAKYRPPML